MATSTMPKEALDFLFSTRGQLIVSQALYHALKAMGSVEPEIMQEKSNMADMQYLRDTLFRWPDEAFDLVLQAEMFAQLKKLPT